MLLGWMSTRVLGQYDLLVVEDPAEASPDDQDLVYYVGPNVLALEKRFAFPPKEFRLWLALHEVTHRAQFTGVPWLREHYLGLVEQTLDSVDPDPKRFFDALTRVLDDLRHGRKPLDDGGLATLLASPAQREVLDKIGGLMSLLEGHGDVTMDRAGADRIPSAHRFARVLRERRANATPVAKLLQRLLGIEAKINQYARGRGVHHRGRAAAAVPRRSTPSGAGRAGCPRWRRSRSPGTGSTASGSPTSSSAEPSLAPDVASLRTAYDHPRMARVLVVDDEPDIVLFAQVNLELHGHEVRTAADGEEALAAVEAEQPDVVVLDVMMPHLDGWGVLERLKAHDDPDIRTIPVMMLTALDTRSGPGPW